MSVIIYPYRKGLNSTRQLREAGCRIRYATSTVRQGVATSWGCKTVPPWAGEVKWINHPLSIHLVSNKLRWAELGLGPMSTTDKSEAQEWAANSKIMCRTILNGSGGAGIVVARAPEEVVDAPLYTRYVIKQREYRVVFSHLLGVHYVASKRLRSDVDLGKDDRLIRTTNTGWVYQVEHDPLPDKVTEELTKVAGVLHGEGLRCLGYDVTFNPERNSSCVIEANSAFGLNNYSGPIVAAALEQLGDMV